MLVSAGSLSTRVNREVLTKSVIVSVGRLGGKGEQGGSDDAQSLLAGY